MLHWSKAPGGVRNGLHWAGGPGVGTGDGTGEGYKPDPDISPVPDPTISEKVYDLHDSESKIYPVSGWLDARLIMNDPKLGIYNYLRGGETTFIKHYTYPDGYYVWDVDACAYTEDWSVPLGTVYSYSYDRTTRVRDGYWKKRGDRFYTNWTGIPYHFSGKIAGTLTKGLGTGYTYKTLEDFYEWTKSLTRDGVGVKRGMTGSGFYTGEQGVAYRQQKAPVLWSLTREMKKTVYGSDITFKPPGIFDIVTARDRSGGVPVELLFTPPSEMCGSGPQPDNSGLVNSLIPICVCANMPIITKSGLKMSKGPKIKTMYGRPYVTFSTEDADLESYSGDIGQAFTATDPGCVQYVTTGVTSGIPIDITMVWQASGRLSDGAWGWSAKGILEPFGNWAKKMS